MRQTATLCLIGIVITAANPAWASCSQAGLAAKQMCSTEKLTSMAQSMKDDILKRFRPSNERMSPESCQGFADAYNDFKKLSQDYSSQCRTKIQEATQSCQVGMTSAEVADFEAGTAQVDAALASLPALKMYAPAMENLDQRLKDCLRHTPGRIANTNTDLGDADISEQMGSPSPSATTTSAAGRILRSQGLKESNPSFATGTSPKVGPGSASVFRPSYCLDPALADSSMCHEPAASSPPTVSAPAGHSKVSTSRIDDSSTTSLRPTRSPSSIQNPSFHSKALHGRRDLSAKASINGPHSNIFKLVHIRYRAHAQLWENQGHVAYGDRGSSHVPYGD